MARIRTVKPEFWEDEAAQTLSRDARLLFIATWNLADDEGLLRWTAEYLKASVFMYDDDLTTKRVAKLMDEVVAGGQIFPYAGAGGQKLAYVVQFRRHQRINRPQPSRLPPPSLQNINVKLMYARRDRYTCHLCGKRTNTTIETPPLDPYGGPDRCGPTGRAIEDDNPSPDHLDPRANGGGDYPSNIATAHVSCNKARGNRPIPPLALNGSPPDSLPDSVNDAVNDSLPDSLPDSVSDSLRARKERSLEQGAGSLEQGAGNARAAPNTAQRPYTEAEYLAGWNPK